tara:strand:+ start:5196 stop:7682 length:2487 start_codon:yes stop_codon:yes gene_type:complete
MGILGKKFRSFVGSQIKKRQKALMSNGASSRSFTTDAPWVRLSSSVNLAKDTAVYKQLNSTALFKNLADLTGNKLAKSFILFNGVTKIGGTSPIQYTGFGAYNSREFNNFGNVGEGLKPMPGITNTEFTYRNDGALSEASVTVKAFNRAQFQVIDVLYQRPGYTVLLEFGHSTFLDNSGNIQNAGKGNYSFYTAPFNKLFKTNNNSDLNHYTLSHSIYNEKKKWQGNYEGAFMKITKFNWKYNMDGSYDITVNLVGIGDVISSLKTNIPPSTKIENNQDDEENAELVEGGNFLVGNANSSLLNQQLYRYYKFISNKLSNQTPWYNEWDMNTSTHHAKITNFPSPKYSGRGDNKVVTGFGNNQNLTINNAIVFIRNSENTQDIEGYGNKMFITFGMLLSLITKHINLKSDKNIPHMFFDLNYMESSTPGTNILIGDRNYISTYEGNTSSDPSKILIPANKNPKSRQGDNDRDIFGKYERLFSTKSILGTISDFGKNEYFVTGNTSQGRLERIYLDANYISKILSENILKGENGEGNLIDFIKKILDDINVNLGGLNEFRVMFNQDQQLVSIISEVPSNSKRDIASSLDVINTLGKGSFVKSLDLKSELSDKFAAQISIGAQAKGNNFQGNAGSFSSYNEGLTDRVIPEKNDTQQGFTTGTVVDVDDKLYELVDNSYMEAMVEVYGKYDNDSEYISKIQNFNSSFSPLYVGYQASRNKSSAQFFLPFNLGLTLHGLGGVRIYDGFKIDGKILPPSYNSSNITLLIKSLSHSITPDGWVTKLETLPNPTFTPTPPVQVTYEEVDTGDYDYSGYGGNTALQSDNTRTPIDFR